MSDELDHYSDPISEGRKYSVSAEDVALVRQALYDAKFAMEQELTAEDFAATLERLTEALDCTSKWK